MTDTPQQPQQPQQGGSFVREKDGSLKREEFTRQPGEPGHGEPAPVAAPKSDKPRK